MNLPASGHTTGLADSSPEQRLHPLSWLFVLLQQLKQFILPLIVLMVFGGRRGPDELWMWSAPVITLGVLIAISVIQYFTYRYRIGGDGLSIRSGWLHRSVREIPFARIHNVGIHQSLLHRVFNVAEVRLESAGGTKPEAQMRVLSLPAALALENLIRHRGQETPTATVTPTASAPAADTLLALSLTEIVRLGLVSNRGMVVVALILGLIWQVLPDRIAVNYLEHYSRQIMGYAGHLHWSWLSMVLAGLGLLILAMALTRVLSVALAIVQFYGFRLSQSDRRLTVEYGLLTRLRSSVSQRRIQAWTLREKVIERWLKRRSLHMDTAVLSQGHQPDEQRALKVLAPIAPAHVCDQLISHLLPQAAWPPAQWHRLPAHSVWRFWLPGLLLTPVLAVALYGALGPWAWLALLGWPWTGWTALRAARQAGYAINTHMIAVRGGGWSRWWRFAEIDKVQALRLSRSPMDRWLGTASVWLDTAGALGFSPPLRLRFLPEPQAREIYQQLGQALAHRRLRW